MPVTTRSVSGDEPKPKSDAAAKETDAKVEGGAANESTSSPAKVEGGAANESTSSPATDAERPTSDKYTGGANPTVNEGDRLPPLGTLSGNVLPPEGTGFHCGVCGQVIGKEGQHYDRHGQVTAVPHANVIVVADNWPENQDAQDAETREADEAAARKADEDK